MLTLKLPGFIAAIAATAALVAAALVLTEGRGVAAPATTSPARAEVAAARAQLAQLTHDNDQVPRNLRTFDTLDFDVFSNQKWDRLKESHARNIRVYWPDGHLTVGLKRHIADLKALFVYAPDTRIKQHPIKFGAGNMTAVTGVFRGTFTKPMPDGKGGFIPPTGKAFKIPMATIGIWKRGVMVEEHLFWDNQTYAKQIGLTP